MAVTLVGTGGLFTRLGKLMGLTDKILTTQALLLSDGSGKSFNDTVGAYAASAALGKDIRFMNSLSDEIQSAAYAMGRIGPAIQNAAAQTLVNMVDEDASTQIRTVQDAMRELFHQMDSGSTLERSTITVGSLTADGSNDGNGTIKTHISPSAVFGSTLTNFPAARSETIKVTCVRDAQDKHVRSGKEIFLCEGGTVYSPFDYRWPGGGGVYGRIPSTCGDVDGDMSVGGNILVNSSFERFTSDVPDQWELQTGSASTHTGSTTTAYRGSKALELKGDGSTLISLRQKLGTTTGTLGTIKPDTVYMIGANLRRESSAITAGVLRVQLENSAGTVFAAKSINCRLEVDCTGLTTTYSTAGTNFVAVRTPKDIRGDIYFTIRLSTALSNTHDLFIDNVFLSEMYQTAPGGIYLGIIAGDNDWTMDDRVSVPITNNHEGLVFKHMDRFFDFHGNGYLLPGAASSPTVADTLIS
tara:strand:+ start:12231 stop:13640 length:1410 start_codon:yes stop_codon:yes gene_type:complete